MICIKALISTFCRSLQRPNVASNARSSANPCRSHGILSLVYDRRLSTTKFHKNGDRIPPCGKPFLLTMDFLHPFSSTFVVLFWSRDIIHLILLTEDDSHFRFRAFSIDLNATLSKAPSTSKNVPRAIPELMIVRSTLCTILCRAVSVEAPFTNPYCFC